MESPGKFDSRTLSRTIINRWTGPMNDVVMSSGAAFVSYSLCTSQYKLLYGETANGSLKQL